MTSVTVPAAMLSPVALQAVLALARADVREAPEDQGKKPFWKTSSAITWRTGSKMLSCAGMWRRQASWRRHKFRAGRLERVGRRGPSDLGRLIRRVSGVGVFSLPDCGCLGSSLGLHSVAAGQRWSQHLKSRGWDKTANNGPRVHGAKTTILRQHLIARALEIINMFSKNRAS